jgi:small GTP-binding protein
MTTRDSQRDGPPGIKVVVVGDGAVGKTSMLVSVVTGKFPKEYIPTVFENHELDRTVDGEKSHLILYDTAGQEEYESLRLLSYTNANVFLLVFSLESPSSFENIARKWLKEVRATKPSTPCIIIGAKSDLREDEGVIAELKSLGKSILSKEEYEKQSYEMGAVKYLECSAAAQLNLEIVLDEAVRAVRKAEEEQRRKVEESKANQQGGGCCVIS